MAVIFIRAHSYMSCESIGFVKSPGSTSGASVGEDEARRIEPRDSGAMRMFMHEKQEVTTGALTRPVRSI